MKLKVEAWQFEAEMLESRLSRNCGLTAPIGVLPCHKWLTQLSDVLSIQYLAQPRLELRQFFYVAKELCPGNSLCVFDFIDTVHENAFVSAALPMTGFLGGSQTIDRRS